MVTGNSEWTPWLAVFRYYCPFTWGWLSKGVFSNIPKLSHLKKSLIWFWEAGWCARHTRGPFENNGKVNFSWNGAFRDCCSDLCQKEIRQCLPATSSKLNGPSAPACLTTICTFKKKQKRSRISFRTCCPGFGQFLRQSFLPFSHLARVARMAALT